MSSTHVDLILGTAGHIDHGKSALVRALTGTDPDRLAEEKQRGITIKLGFAQLTLPNGKTMGVVDVPGHERFVKQMIAGATGVDVALLVIAADDGIMPQTIEHVAVLQTLGIRTCVVALTKSDLVDEDWLEFVSGEIRSFLAATPYQNAPIVAVSSKTGAGLDELKSAIQTVSAPIERTQKGSDARMPIDRVFTINGTGTVVTGTLWSGVVAIGDELEVLPQGKTYRVRSIQEHSTPVEAAHPGNRVALNLADATTADVVAGDFLAAPATTPLTDRFDCAFTYLDTAKTNKPLTTGARMHIAHGTREVVGRVLFCDGIPSIAPGQTAYAQIRLEEELPLRAGDRFVVRTYSPVRVAGGGTVLLAHPRRRTNLSATMRTLLDELAASPMPDEPSAHAVELAIATLSTPTTAAQLTRLIGADRASIDRALNELESAPGIVSFGAASSERFYASDALMKKSASAIERTLISFHSKNPAETGMPKEQLRRACFPNMSGACFDALCALLTQTGAIVARGGIVGHPSAQGSAQQALDNAADALYALLQEQGLSPETLDYLAKRTGLTPQMTGKAAAALVETGRAYRVANNLIFDAAAVVAAKKAVAAHLEAGKPGTAAALKEVMGTSRKFAMPLLEKFDAEGFTRRTGDERELC